MKHAQVTGRHGKLAHRIQIHLGTRTVSSLFIMTMQTENVKLCMRHSLQMCLFELVKNYSLFG